MKERRYQNGVPSLAQVWKAGWLVLGVFFAVLWVTEAPARDYDYDRGGYRGWRSDMLEEERRQTRIMERQEERELRRERHQNYEESRANWRRYNERLRRGGW